MTAYFITGTGTDIGKTWLACALLRHWRAAGKAVSACKPVMSGFDEASLAQTDAGLLLDACGSPTHAAAIHAISPWRFAAPLSPDMAAAREGKAIDFGALVRFTRLAVAQSDVIAGSMALVEGVGGVMVPLDARHTVRDWIAEAALPAVLLTGSYLGSMSHALAALAALREKHVAVAAIVLNESPDAGVPLEDTRKSLMWHAGKVPVVPVHRASASAGVAHLATVLERAA